MFLQHLLKIPLHFSANSVAEIVQYCLYNSVLYTLLLFHQS